MATVTAAPGAGPVLPGGQVPAPTAVNLSTAQTGNGQSTNVVDRGGWTGPALVKVTTTVGATPTVTILIEASADGSNWWPAPYVDSATPGTLSVATFVITTATTVYKHVKENYPWRFLRLTYSANTNVTSTADCWVF